MYRFYVWLLRRVRAYCVHQCGDSWFNLWQDMADDAECYRPPASTSLEVTHTFPAIELKAAIPERMLERVNMIAADADLLRRVTVHEPTSIFDVEDACRSLCTGIDAFQEMLDQLPGDGRPNPRRVTPLSELYDKYRHGCTASNDDAMFVKLADMSIRLGQLEQIYGNAALK